MTSPTRNLGKPWARRFFLLGGESPHRVNQLDQLAFHLRMGGTPTPFAAAISNQPDGDDEIVTAANGGMLQALTPLMVNEPIRILRLRWALRFPTQQAPTRTWFLRILRTRSGETASVWRSSGISWTANVSAAETWHQTEIEGVNLTVLPREALTFLVRAEHPDGSFHNGASILARGSAIVWMDCCYRN